MKQLKVENQITWKESMPVYIEVLRNKSYSPKSKKIAAQELMRLAREVDKINGLEIYKKK